LSDDDLIPDVELTTTSEINGKPFDNNKHDLSEQDKDQNEKVAHHHGYKVRFFLVLYSMELIVFDRVPGMNRPVMTR